MTIASRWHSRRLSCSEILDAPSPNREINHLRAADHCRAWRRDLGGDYYLRGSGPDRTITPLIRECKSQDTILVQINPIERNEPARSASEILNRLNEVSFNAVLLKELRMMALLRQVADPGNSEGAQWAGMRIHRIGSEMLTELGASSKLNAEWEFFTLLHDEGRRSAQVFLETHAMDLGSRSTLDIDALLEQV